MKKNKKSEQIKLAVIPVLVIILFAVLFGDDGKPKPTAATSTAAPVADTAAQTVERPAVAARTAEAETPQIVMWPTESLQTILSHNPFELQDQRAILDAAFIAAGLYGDVTMTEISETEFFESDPDTEVASVPALLESLMGFVNSLPELPAPVERLQQQPPEETESEIQQRVQNAVTAAATRASLMEEANLAALRQNALERLHQRIQALQQQPVTMVMETPKGKSALLQDRPIQEGEVVEDGIRVTLIDRDGVTFEIDENAVKTIQ